MCTVNATLEGDSSCSWGSIAVGLGAVFCGDVYGETLGELSIPSNGMSDNRKKCDWN